MGKEYSQALINQDKFLTASRRSVVALIGISVGFNMDIARIIDESIGLHIDAKHHFKAERSGVIRHAPELWRKPAAP